MANSNGHHGRRHKSHEQVAGDIELQLNKLIAVVRRREEEGNFVDVELVVKATVLVVSGQPAREVMVHCGIPIGEHEV